MVARLPFLYWALVAYAWSIFAPAFLRKSRWLWKTVAGAKVVHKSRESSKQPDIVDEICLGKHALFLFSNVPSDFKKIMERPFSIPID
jgi:hypothetical protein